MKDSMPKLLKAGYGPTIREVTPPHLLMYEERESVPAELTSDDRSNGKMTRLDIAKYDRIREKIKRTNALMKKQLQEGLQQHRISLGAILTTAMIGTAPLSRPRAQARGP